MPRQAKTLVAAPDVPSGVWIYADADDEIFYECGRCGVWWFPAADDSILEDELSCASCVRRLYADKMRRSADRPPVSLDRSAPCSFCGAPSRPDDCPVCAEP